MNKKFIFPLLALTLILSFAIPQAFAYNSLQDTNLHAQSGIITLDIEIGQDKIQTLFSKNIFTPQIDNIAMTFYGDEIDMSDSYLKVYGDGRLFSIKNVEQGIVIYAKQNPELDNYQINIYFATNQGLQKFIVQSDMSQPDEKTIETIQAENKQQYIPELKIASSHDFKTYWRETFNIDVQVYDGRINPKAEGFEGRLDNANVTVILSYEDTNIKLSSITTYGNWDGEYYFIDNISKAGEYTVDVLVSYLNQTVSKSSSMFVIGSVADNGSSNKDYDNDGILNISETWA